MRLTEQFDINFWAASYQEYPWFRYLLFGTAAVIGLWILGKAAKLTAEAVVNFKTLKNVIQQ
ncbi:MAG: hypothetical protein IPP81_12915 [Chitinophagaceae bacterium]|nr:hypothetical protein [Chitinophagaceae bacterium]